MQQINIQRHEQVQIWLSLQVFLSHAIVGGVTFAIGNSLQQNGYFPNASILGIFLAGCVGVLLTFNIQQGVYVLEIALNCLMNGSNVVVLPSIWRWPFNRLITQISILSQRVEHQVQHTQQNIQYKNQLLEHVHKIAVREERNRLARDLHDSIKQQLFSIVMSATAIKVHWKSIPAAEKAIDDILRNAQEAQVEMQALLQQLHPAPLENTGLLEAIRIQCEALRYRTGAEVATELGELPTYERLPLGTQEHIFRIVQEAFSNIARHARASYVRLEMSQEDDELIVKISDNGEGFENIHEQKVHMGTGLRNMRERIQVLSGTLHVQSILHQGTTITIHVPLINPLQVSQYEEAKLEVIERQAKNALQVGRKSLLFAIFMFVGNLLLLLTVREGIVLTNYVLIEFGFLITVFGTGLSILVALAMYVRTQQYRIHMVIATDERSLPSLALKSAAYRLLIHCFVVCSIYAFCFVFYSTSIEIHVFLSVADIFGLLATTICILWLYPATHYCRLLSLQKLRSVVRERQYFCIRNFSIWVIFLILAPLAFTRFQSILLPSYLSQEQIQLIDYGWFAVQSLWFLIIVFDVAQLVHMMRSIGKRG